MDVWPGCEQHGDAEPYRCRRTLLRRHTIGAGVLATFAANPPAALASSVKQGLTATQLMQGVAFWASIMAIVLLVIVEFLLRRSIGRATYHWLLLLGIFVLPAISLLGTSEVVFEESKTVSSCAACHSMDPFLRDMLSPTSSTLAARHYRNKWIADDQCYQCHTTYGIHGTIDAKLDGMRHWWKYVTNDWHRPIQLTGEYPDSNCLVCHEGTPKYQNAWPHHQGVFKAEKAGEVHCVFCHGPPHPTAAQRVKETKAAGSATPPHVANGAASENVRRGTTLSASPKKEGEE